MIQINDVSRYQDAWIKAKPFPHIVIDDFVETSSMLVRDFPNISWPNWVPLGDSYQKNKYICSDLGVFPNDIRNLIEELASPKFLKVLEQITSIDGLIPDPYLAGGGLHLSLAGGILAPHTDFHIYQKLGLYRRLNLILYLNENWQQGDGGELELSLPKEQLTERYLVEPLSNRAVLFKTDDRSVHGFTSPIRQDTVRQSIAVYYYTSYETNIFSGDQTTHWRTHGSLSVMKLPRLMLYKFLLKISRMFSLVAQVINPNQGIILVRTRLRHKNSSTPKP